MIVVVNEGSPMKMKKSVFLLSFLLLIFLSACGSGAADRMVKENEDGALREQIAALEGENAALQERIAALEEENDRLSLTNDLLDQDLAAAQDALEQLEAQQGEENPIDPFYDEMNVECDTTTVAMSTVAWSHANAWEAEVRNLAEQMKAQLPLQEDRDLVDAYIAAVEEQAQRMDVMSIYTVSDIKVPQEERRYTAGTLAYVLQPESRAQIWRDTFYQLRWTLLGDGEYDFIFDPEAARLELADVMKPS